MGIVVALATSACASDSSDDVGDEGEDDVALADACTQWCVATTPCDTLPPGEALSEDECTAACVADVGTPGPDCTAAIAEWAACLQTGCGEMACQDEAGARTAACGGTG